MKASEITVENYENVYSHFRDFSINRGIIRHWYRFVNIFLHPRVHYAKNARKDLDLIRDQDYHHVYALNHRGHWDAHVYQPVIHQIAPDEVGNLRVMANSFIFEASYLRPFNKIVKSLGFIPVFLKPYYANYKPHKDYPERLKMLPVAAQTLLDCFVYVMTEHRQKILCCPEGEYNDGAPDTLLPLRRGMSEIVYRVAKIDGPVAITPLALAYSGKDWKKNKRMDPRNVSVVIGRSIFVDAGMDQSEITKRVNDELLASVRKAAKLY